MCPGLTVTTICASEDLHSPSEWYLRINGPISALNLGLAPYEAER